jgi:hypothetical protein
VPHIVYPTTISYHILLTEFYGQLGSHIFGREITHIKKQNKKKNIHWVLHSKITVLLLIGKPSKLGFKGRNVYSKGED